MLYHKIYRNDQSTEWVTFIHGAGGSSTIWFKQLRAYHKKFNVLLIDLRGHGGSNHVKWKRGDTFQDVSEDVLEVLDSLGIASSHFVGISLGTIVIQTITKHYPERVKSMVLGGAVVKLDLRAKFCIVLGSIFKFFVPYMWLYKTFAWIIMPYSHSKESRVAFVEQAKRMCQREFLRWFRLTKRLNPFLKRVQTIASQIPTLFIMGAEDYLLLTQIKALIKKQPELKLACIEDCGHVVNIEQPAAFNDLSIRFIQDVSFAQ